MAGDYAGIYYIFTHALPYLIVTILIYRIVEIIFDRRFLSDRDNLAQRQRHVYFEQLSRLSHEIEAESAREKENISRRIQDLKRQYADLRNQLDDSSDDDDTPDGLREELNSLERDKKELSRCQRELLEDDISDNIDEKIKEFQKENEGLESAMGDHITYSTVSGQNRELLEFLKTHDNDLPISYLFKMYDTLLGLKATESLKEVEAFGQSNYVQHINNLMIEKKKVELDLQKMKEQYKKEVDTIRDALINFLLLVENAQAQIDNLKHLNKITEELIELEREAANGSEKSEDEPISVKDFGQYSHIQMSKNNLLCNDTTGIISFD